MKNAGLIVMASSSMAAGLLVGVFLNMRITTESTKIETASPLDSRCAFSYY